MKGKTKNNDKYSVNNKTKKIDKVRFISEKFLITLSSQYVPIKKYPREKNNDFNAEDLKSSKSISSKKNSKLNIENILIL